MGFEDQISKADQKIATAEHGFSNLQAAGYDIPASKQTEKIDGPHKAEIDKQFGGQDGFVKAQHDDFRKQYGLPTNAPSEALYHKMAADAVQIFPHMNAADKAAGLKSLGLDNNSVKDPDKVFKALIDRDRRDSNLPILSLPELKANNGAAISAAEKASQVKAYSNAVKNGLDINYD